MRSSALALVPALLAAAVLPAPAQDKKDATLAETYKVEFRIKDGSDAAAKNGRRYTMLIDTTGRGAFHAGDRVPVATSASQWSYFDTGVSIDTRIHEQQGKVAIDATIDISTVVMHKPAGPADLASLQPTVSQIKISVNATVAPGKPSLVASIDDPVSERRFDVEAVVTKMD